MAFTLNTSVLRTPTGILKVVEIVLVLIVLMVARFSHHGKDMNMFGPGNADNSFLGQGISVGYAIIVPSVLVTYLLGANLSILELFINFIGRDKIIMLKNVQKNLPNRRKILISLF